MRPATRSICLLGQASIPASARFLPQSSLIGFPLPSFSSHRENAVHPGAPARPAFLGSATGGIGRRPGDPGGTTPADPLGLRGAGSRARLFSASALPPPQTQSSSSGSMGLYRIRVSTGSSLCAGSNNQVQLWLVGQHGEAAIGTRLRPARGQVSRGARGSLRPGRQARCALGTCSCARPPRSGPATRGPCIARAVSPPVPSILKSCPFKPSPRLLGVRPAGFLARTAWGWGRRRKDRGKKPGDENTEVSPTSSLRLHPPTPRPGSDPPTLAACPGLSKPARCGCLSHGRFPALPSRPPPPAVARASPSPPLPGNQARSFLSPGPLGPPHPELRPLSAPPRPAHRGPSNLVTLTLSTASPLPRGPTQPFCGLSDFSQTFPASNVPRVFSGQIPSPWLIFETSRCGRAPVRLSPLRPSSLCSCPARLPAFPSPTPPGRALPPEGVPRQPVLREACSGRGLSARSLGGAGEGAATAAWGLLSPASPRAPVRSLQARRSAQTRSKGRKK